MATMKAYDPTIVDLPPIKLVGRVYELSEVDGERMKRVAGVQEQLEALDESASDDEAMRLVCEQIELSVQKRGGGDATGLGQKLFDAFQHGKHSVTMQMLMRTSLWIQQQHKEQATLGEG